MKYNQNPIYRQMITSPEWRKLRAKKLRQDPFCERCKAVGIYTWATEVHHIQPIDSVSNREAMERLAFNPNNLQSLCHSCHAEAHKELGRLSRRAVEERTQSKVEAFADKFFGTEDKAERPGG